MKEDSTNSCGYQFSLFVLCKAIMLSQCVILCHKNNIADFLDDKMVEDFCKLCHVQGYTEMYLG